MAACYVEDPVDGRGVRRGGARRWPRPASRRWCCQAGPLATSAPRAARSHTGARWPARRACSRPRPCATRAASRCARRASWSTRRGRCSAARAAAGRRVAVLADGGGHGVLAADLLTDAGLRAAAAARPTTAARVRPSCRRRGSRTRSTWPARASRTCYSFARITRRAARRDPASTACSDRLLRRLRELLRRGRREQEVEVAAPRSPQLRDASGKPLLVHSMQVPATPPGDRRRCAAPAVPTYERDRERDPRRSTRVLAAPAGAAARGGAGACDLARRPRDAIPRRARCWRPAGIAFPRRRPGRATTPRRRRIAARLGAPVALKAVGADLLHKTDAGGVAARRRPGRRRRGRARRSRARAVPGMALDGVFVERMAAAGGVDLVVGARRDPTLRARWCWSASAASSSRRSTTSSSRSRRPTRRTSRRCCATLRAVAAAGRARAAPRRSTSPPSRGRRGARRPARGPARPGEIEVNPLRATADGVIALDARIVVA